MADQSLTLDAARTILSGNVLGVPFFDREIATEVPYTVQSAATPFKVYDFPVGGSNGALLSSVSIAVDSVFQTNYLWTLFIDGVTGPTGNQFESFDPTVNTFEAVPASKTYLLKPQAHVQIKAYNANSGNNNNGIISVFVVAGMLNPAEAAVLQKYQDVLAAVVAEQ
jgi:hypothetical protein